MAFPQTILPLRTELYYDGAWQDITPYVYQRENIEIKRGRADESANIEPSSMDLTLDNRDGRFSPRNPRSPLYGKIGRNTPIRQSIIQSTSYLQITQATGTTATVANVSTPDAATLDITGDIDIRFEADLSTWTESMEIVSKWQSAGDQRSYALILVAGKLRVFVAPDGTLPNYLFYDSPPLPAEGRYSYRVTVDVNNGSGGTTITWYQGTGGVNGTWTQMGSPVVANLISSFFSGSGQLAILDNPQNTLQGSVIRGKIYGVQVRNGIGGTVVANPDFTAQTVGATSFVDSAGRTWTLNGNVLLDNKDIRFTGEVTSWPQRWDTAGKDIYSPISCAGIFRRLGQGAAPLNSTFKSGILKTANVVAYWPMEETGGTSFASATGNAVPIDILYAVPDFEADDAWNSSMPLPNLKLATYIGTVPTYTSTGVIQFRFLLHVPADGAPNDSVLFRLQTSGTAATWEVQYGTGGTMKLNIYDAAGATLYTSGYIVYQLNNDLNLVQLQMVQNGANVDWSLATYTPGGTAGTVNITLNNRTIGLLKKFSFNPTRNIDDTSIGHVYVQSAASSIYDLRQQLNAYSGETAGRRIQRLCRENDVDIQGDGNLSNTELMGPQLPDTFLNLIKECADSDMGLLYEPRDQVAVGYRPRTALYTGVSELSLDYNLHQMMDLVPVEDDQSTRNDITVTREFGSSYRATDTTSRLSVNSPPAGVGIYDDAVKVSLASDSQLSSQAGWRLMLGTIDEARYPTINLNMASPSQVPLGSSVRQVDIGSMVTVLNPPVWLPPEPINQLVQGYEETLNAYVWELSFNCSPASPYLRVGLYGGGGTVNTFRYAPEGSTLTAGYTSSATSLSVASSKGRWSISDGPFDILVAGERVTVTNVTGATSPQTFTVTRAVNGVSKAQSSGAAVELFAPTYYAI